MKVYTAGIALTMFVSSAAIPSETHLTLEDCISAPEVPCVDIIVNQLLAGSDSHPGSPANGEHANRIVNLLALTPRLEQAEQVAYLLPDQFRESVLGTIATHYAELGQLDEVRRLMRMVQDIETRDYIRFAIAKTEIALGNEDVAGVLVGAIESPSIRDDALSTLAASLIDAGNFDGTFELSRSVSNPIVRSFVLCLIIASATEPEHIKRAIGQADQIKDPSDRVKGLVQLAAFLASHEWQSEALELFARIEKDLEHLQISDDEKQNLQEILNGRLIELGFLDMAIPAIARVQNLDTRINLLTYVAHHYTIYGETEKAEAFYRQSLDLARATSDPRARDEQLAYILPRLSLADIALREQAHTFADLIEDPKRRGELLRILALEFAALGQFELAENRLRSIDDPAIRIEGLMTLSRDLAQSSMTARAQAIFREVVEEIETGGSFATLHIGTQQEIIKTANQLGAFRRARDFVLQINEPNTRIIALSEIALATLEAGDEQNGRAWLHDAAREIDQVIGAMQRIDLAYRLAIWSEHIGDLRENSTILQMIKDDELRQLYLYEVARHWLTIEGRQQDARELVDRFGSSDVRKSIREREIENALRKALRLESGQE
ncbi:hypothetical protein [uncultured Roseibium sp.]|uniref:hypothetical protein n=1 Tax=uncultured Roseibium sp. TaxID=1936171 RepID=UPI00262F080E|nr:hypothetical protein [uncultured Roseibium sp.]